MANALSVELHAQAEETSNGSGTVVDIGATRSALRLTLRVLAAVGDFFVKVETSPDGASGWRQVGAFDEVEQSRKPQLLHLDDCEQFIRVSWELAGATTFICRGTAHTLFALQEDLFSELPERFLKKATNNLTTNKLIIASTHAESAIYTATLLPVTKWDLDITHNVAMLAAFEVMTFLGFLPEGTDDVIVMKWKAALKFFEKIRERKNKPPGLEPAARLDAQTSSGDPLNPDRADPRMSDNWGDF